MSGVKFRSGDIPKAHKAWRMTVEDRAKLVIERILKDKDLGPLEKAKVALPIYLKTMTDRQAITQITTTLELDQAQVAELMSLARANSLIYKELGDSG